MSKPKSVPLYGNWRMLSPSGELMCRCSERRARWYVSRGLAADRGGEAFQLLFEPGGVGNAGRPDMLAPKLNHCVVCASPDELNRHHVVPYQFRRHMPLSRKAHSSTDIVSICLEHHELYELSAQELSGQIVAELGLSAPNAPLDAAMEAAAAKRRALARLLLRARREGLPVPAARVEQIEAELSSAVGSAESQALELWLAEAKRKVVSQESKLGRIVVEKLMELGDEKALGAFEDRWRKHFVETMRPKHLATAWSEEMLAP